MATYKEALLEGINPLIIDCDMIKNITLDDIIIHACLSTTKIKLSIFDNAKISSIKFNEKIHCSEFTLSSPYQSYSPYPAAYQFSVYIGRIRSTDEDGSIVFWSSNFDNYENVILFCYILNSRHGVSLKQRSNTSPYFIVNCSELGISLKQNSDIPLSSIADYYSPFVSYNNTNKNYKYVHNLFLYMLECSLSYNVYNHVADMLCPYNKGYTISDYDKKAILEQYEPLLYKTTPINNKVLDELIFDDMIILLCSYLIHDIKLLKSVFHKNYITHEKYRKPNCNHNTMLLYGIIYDIENDVKISKHYHYIPSIIDDCDSEFIISINYVFPMEYIYDIVEKMKNTSFNIYLIYVIYKVLFRYTNNPDSNLDDFCNQYLATTNFKSARKC